MENTLWALGQKLRVRVRSSFITRQEVMKFGPGVQCGGEKRSDSICTGGTRGGCGSKEKNKDMTDVLTLSLQVG